MVSIELIYEAWNVQVFEDYELLIIDFEKNAESSSPVLSAARKQKHIRDSD